MRAFLPALLFSILMLLPSSGNAGDRRLRIAALNSDKSQSNETKSEMYRGYFLDLTAIAERPDFSVIANELRHQVDIVEGVGLSQRVLQFFHTVPILVDEFACLGTNADPKPETKTPVLAVGCYGPFAPERLRNKSHWFSRWDGAKSQWDNLDQIDQYEYANLGVVMVRPLRIDAQTPVVLHELLHAYHAHILPEGVKNPAVLHYYNLAKSEQLYLADAYLLTNEREFFAVTASVFLYGKDDKEPFTRLSLKQKQPDYYNYLVWLFGFDPDSAPASPVASAF